MGDGASDRQRERRRRPAAVHRAVRADDVADVSGDFGALRPRGGPLGGSDIERCPRPGDHRRHLGFARWSAIGRVARHDGLPDRRAAVGRPRGLGMVVGDGRLRGSGALFQVFRRAYPGRRGRVSGDRATQPSLAQAAAPLPRRSRRAGDLSAGADLERPTRVGLVPVPGQPRGRFAPPVRAAIGDRRPGRISPSVDLGAPDVVRLSRVAPRALQTRSAGSLSVLLHRQLCCSPWPHCGAMRSFTGRHRVT